MLRTAECVSPSHPDKMCDRISDSILDAYLEKDPNARVAIEVMGGHGRVFVTGEVTSTANIKEEDMYNIIYKIVGEKNILIDLTIAKQSPEIAQGVDTGGAGDQGIMVGYACNENEDMLPQELFLARSLCQFIYHLHEQDGKTQVTIDENGVIKTIVASFCNVENIDLQYLVETWVYSLGDQRHIQMFINPAGDWNIGGFEADTGLTGRKLAVDNYGPRVPIGGGAFSGKDATKVDRSGAYMARLIAVSALKKKNADEVFVWIAYSIGVAKPVMVTIKTVKNGKEEFDAISGENLNSLTPNSIIDILELKKPQFAKLAEWGHMGVGAKWDS